MESIMHMVAALVIFFIGGPTVMALLFIGPPITARFAVKHPWWFTFTALMVELAIVTVILWNL
jgi:hypothetical protein